MNDSAVVLFSGGQDSTTCLAWALSRFNTVHTLGFDYAQRHSVELACRQEVLRQFRSRFPAWREKLAQDRVIDLSMLSNLTSSALLSNVPFGTRADNLPNTFVPGRNLMFLLVAAIFADQMQAGALVGGMCQTDFSGYPDCREDSVLALEKAINLGMASQVKIETPLMNITKADTWALAYSLGGSSLIEVIVDHTHTCYDGNRTKHEWGHGCGVCSSCNLRLLGYSDYLTGR